MKLILASGSPRRKELLTSAGLSFDVVVSQVDESERRGEAPRAMVLRLANEKAAAVSRQRPGAYVVAADTTVALAGRVLGKPVSDADAARMLARLSGQAHEVLTGFCVLAPSGRRVAKVVRTRVTFRKLSRSDIARYVATQEPHDKAGAYAIQGLGAACVDRVNGSYTNVVGLPVREVLAALATVGFRAP